MKLKFTSQSKATAEKFQKYIKTDRNLDSTITDKDGKFYVEYSVANVKMPAKKVTANMITPDKCDTAGVAMVEQPQYMEYDEVMDCMSELASYFYQEMQYQMNWIWAEIDYIENAFYQHVSSGHLPPINGADKMTKALDVLGLSGDYQVQKPIIYASVKNKVPTMDLDFPDAKK